MPDPADLADVTIAEHLERSLQQQVGKSAPEFHPEFDGTNCVECDEEIHPARLQLGRVRCITCQEMLEHRARLGL